MTDDRLCLAQGVNKPDLAPLSCPAPVDGGSGWTVVLLIVTRNWKPKVEPVDPTAPDQRVSVGLVYIDSTVLSQRNDTESKLARRGHGRKRLSGRMVEYIYAGPPPLQGSSSQYLLFPVAPPASPMSMTSSASLACMFSLAK